jgi:hypothetical protein
MIVKENFEIVFVDHSDCECLLTQVRFKNIVLCEINKEKGNERMEVELLCNDVLYNGLKIEFSLDDFVEALKVAKEKLMVL